MRSYCTTKIPEFHTGTSAGQGERLDHSTCGHSTASVVQNWATNTIRHSSIFARQKGGRPHENCLGYKSVEPAVGWVHILFSSMVNLLCVCILHAVDTLWILLWDSIYVFIAGNRLRLSNFNVAELYATEVAVTIIEEALAIVLSTLQEIVYYRYYHVFRHGELEEMAMRIPSLELVSAAYDSANWCAVLEKSND